MKKVKVKTERQLLLEKNIFKIQDFEQPEKEPKRFIRLSHYMLNHINYKKLSSSAKVALTYMLDWAFASDEFVKTQCFDFSTTLLTRNNIMANKTAITSLKELEYYGFIQKENNACKYSGITQKWSFSNTWYSGEKSDYKSNWYGK